VLYSRIGNNFVFPSSTRRETINQKWILNRSEYAGRQSSTTSPTTWTTSEIGKKKYIIVVVITIITAVVQHRNTSKTLQFNTSVLNLNT